MFAFHRRPVIVKRETGYASYPALHPLVLQDFLLVCVRSCQCEVVLISGFRT